MKTKTKKKKKLTVNASELSNIRMVAGNENKYSKVIVGSELKEWVAIGWITLRKATPADADTYPRVIYS